VIKEQKCDGCYFAVGAVLDSDRTCTVIAEITPKDLPKGFINSEWKAAYILQFVSLFAIAVFFY
jgi:hypothetical protein